MKTIRVVYLVEGSSQYEGSTVLGVFSSRLRACEYAEQYRYGMRKGNLATYDSVDVIDYKVNFDQVPL